jgi:hypothetical protein
MWGETRQNPEPFEKSRRVRHPEKQIRLKAWPTRLSGFGFRERLENQKKTG